MIDCIGAQKYLPTSIVLFLSLSLLCERSFADAGSLPLLSINTFTAEYVNNVAAGNILLLSIFNGQSCVEDSHCVSLNTRAHNLLSDFQFSEKTTSRPNY
jgi:hypothetical protein